MPIAPAGWAAISAVATVAAAAYSIYSAANAPGPPKIPPPPTAAGAVQYDENGNALVVQTWDPVGNTYVTRYDPFPVPDPPDPNFGYTKPTNTQSKKYVERLDAYNKGVAEGRKAWEEKWKNEYEANKDNPRWLATQNPAYREKIKSWEGRQNEKARVEELKSQMLSNLNQTPEDRIKAYENYAKTYSETLHAETDKKFDETQRSVAESMAARGMTGSRADVDTTKEMVSDKAKADLDIAREAQLRKEDLANTDKQIWLNTYNALSSGARADAAQEYALAGEAATNASMANSAAQAAWQANASDLNQRWQAEREKQKAISDNLNGGLQGIAYLAGQYGAEPKTYMGTGSKAFQTYTAPKLKTESKITFNPAYM